MKLYEVGGFVRDSILGRPSDDVDFTVVLEGHERAICDVTGADPFLFMCSRLESDGFTIWQERPEHFTARAKFPKDSEHEGITADFVLARIEGPYSDNRRPDWVKPGELEDDLARRDFTMNAIARDAVTGDIIDPYDGTNDTLIGLIRAVGNAEERIRQDPLRALRAIRFFVTLGFDLDADLMDVLESDWLPDLIAVPKLADRKRIELRKAFRHDTLATVRFLAELPDMLLEAIFSDGLWLMPTMKGK